MSNDNGKQARRRSSEGTPSSAGGAIAVLSVVEHAVLRTAVRALLSIEPDIRVLGDAASEEEGVDLARLLRPDVVLLDVAVSARDPSRAVRQIREAHAPARVLLLTFDSSLGCRQAEAWGACGYVRKTKADRELVHAIRAAVDGNGSRDRDSDGGDDGDGKPPGPPPVGTAGWARSPLDDLSQRERQVISLAAHGFSSREIGEKLHISSKTVDTYRARSMGKLGISRRWELVEFALRYGLLRPL